MKKDTTNCCCIFRRFVFNKPKRKMKVVESSLEIYKETNNEDDDDHHHQNNMEVYRVNKLSASLVDIGTNISQFCNLKTQHTLYIVIAYIFIQISTKKPDYYVKEHSNIIFFPIVVKIIGSALVLFLYLFFYMFFHSLDSAFSVVHFFFKLCLPIVM